MSKFVNPRLCIEEAILRFKPDISDKELLDLREEIYLKVWKETKSNDVIPLNSVTHIECYERDYYLYSRKRYV